MKALVNSVYDQSSSKTNGDKRPYLFDALDKNSNKDSVLKHLFSLEKTKNDELFRKYNELLNLFQEIRKKRQEHNKATENNARQKLGKEINELQGKETKLKQTFGEMFQKYHHKVTSSIHDDFGACSDCVGFLTDKKRKKKYKEILDNFDIDHTK